MEASFPPVSQRLHPRQPVRLRALTQAGIDPERLGIVTDLSLSGAFIETHTHPHRGSNLWVSLTLTDGSLFHAYVEVVRVTPRGVGVRFIRLDPDAPVQFERAMLG